MTTESEAVAIGAGGSLSASPKVSVCIITYNHEPFLAQALDSVLMQRVDFPYEIVIGEDGSTDGTAAIVEAYRQKHPHLIRALPNERNLGGRGKANFLRTFYACRAPYISYLDGDDYWLDANKLAMQAAFLDANPKYGGCATRAQEVSHAGPGRVIPESSPDDITVSSILRVYPFYPATAMFRRVAAPLPEWFGTVGCGDWALYVLHALHGPFRLLQAITAAYRIHEGGVSSGASLRVKVQFFNDFYASLAVNLPAHSRDIARGWENINYWLIHQLAAVHDWAGARAVVRILATRLPASGLLGLCYFVGLGIYVLAGSLFHFFFRRHHLPLPKKIPPL